MNTLLNNTFERVRRRGLFRDLFTVGSLSVLVKVLGAAKLAVIAAVFGTGSELDAYLIAFLVPSLLADVLSGSVSAAMVPTLLRIRTSRGRTAAVTVYRNVLAGSIMLLTMCAIAAGVLASAAVPAFNAAHADERTRWIYPLLLLLLPVLPVSAATVTWRALLHSEQRFWVAAAAPGITPVVSIALLLAVKADWGAYVLAAGTLGGTVLEMVILGTAVRGLGFPVLPLWKGFDADLRDVIRHWLPFVAGTFVLGGAVFVDQGFAILLGPGGVSVLNYGTKLTTVLLAIGAATVGTVSLPYLSRMAAAEDWTRMRRAMRNSVLMVVIVAVPVTAVLMWLSGPLVRLYLERGVFSAAMADDVAWVQQFSLIQLPLGIVLALVMRLMASLQANHLLFRVAVATLAVNALADAVLMRYFGAAGIAAADSVAALVTLAYLGALLQKHTSQKTFISTATPSA
jgi:putative peptidoglycan lipid II flippase